MKVLTFHFRSNLSYDDVMKLAESREDQYKDVRGLKQIVYMKDERINQYGSILFFETDEDLNNFRSSELSRSLKEVYNIVGLPEIRIFDVIKQLSP
jgi:hypothetical protein